jgi:thioester reductase-like protein
VRLRHDGNLEFLDRVDHQEKIRGFRIELSEIETVLEQYADVQQCIVIAREDEPGSKRLVAYIVVSRNNDASLIPQLRSYLQGKLPGYMVPAVFILLDTLPLTPNGKINRRALPAPSADRRDLDETFIAPQTQLEQEISIQWSKVLGLSTIGVNDNFFDLGGDSLRSTQLIYYLEKAYQVVVPLVDFFRIPTVAGLANLIHHLQNQLPTTTEWMSLSDLNAEAVLDASIQLQIFDQPSTPTQSPVRSTEPPILLTGVTGFLGGFLLHELLQQTQAQIHCLIRAKNHAEAQHKLCVAIKHLPNIDTFYSRIIPVKGDLAQPLLGLTRSRFQKLAKTIGSIYHSGAMVNLLYPYTALRDTNVGGTQEILRLASLDRLKPIHYLSTLDVFESLGTTGVHTFYEDDDIAQGEGILNGYSQSKWVAEQLMRQGLERGIPVTIYRPGMITGHSQSGHTNVVDVFCRLIKTCIQLRQAPDLDLMLDMTPVDYVCQSLVHLSLNPSCLGKTFHLINPQPMALAQVVEQLRDLGYPMRTIPYSQWEATLSSEPNTALSPLLAAITQANSQSRNCLEVWLGGDDIYDCRNTNLGLQGSSITCPPANSSLVKTYLTYLIQNGFLINPISQVLNF